MTSCCDPRVLWRPYRLCSSAIFVAAALLAVSCTDLGRESAALSASKPLPVLVRARTLVEETRTRSRRFSGYMHPWGSSGVGFLVGGRVTALHVEEGDEVTKGQLLAEIAPEDFALVRRLAEVQVQALEPNVARVDRLVKERVLPASQYDEIHGKYRAAITQRDRARRQFDYTRLYAPIDGVVMEREASLGQIIGTGSPAVVLLDLSKLSLRLGVVQQDLALFSRGQRLEVQVPGQAGTRPGIIHHIAAVPDKKTRTYEIVVVLQNPVSVEASPEAGGAPGSGEAASAPGASGRRALRAGMLGQVQLQAKQSTGVFVPLLAIRRGLDGGYLVSVLGAGSRVEERSVVLGDLYEDEVQVLEGLEPGARVITEGQGFVSAGDVVRVR